MIETSLDAVIDGITKAIKGFKRFWGKLLTF